MLSWFSQYFSQLGYLAIAIAMLAEGLTLPCPALIVLLMAGAASAAGKISFGLAALVAAVAYTLGAFVPYYLGYNLLKLQNFPWVGKLIVTSLQALDQVNGVFGRHGDKAVAIMRPFWIGNLISYFAGLNRMPFYKFVGYTFIGIAPWSVGVIFVGKIFSTNLARAAGLIKHYSGIAFVIMLVLILGGWFIMKMRQQRQSLPVTRD